jgi:hypothetical protein
MFQTQHQDQWEERVGKPRLIELKQGLSPGPPGLTEYLDRLEQAAKQYRRRQRTPLPIAPCR